MPALPRRVRPSSESWLDISTRLHGCVIWPGIPRALGFLYQSNLTDVVALKESKESITRSLIWGKLLTKCVKRGTCTDLPMSLVETGKKKLSSVVATYNCGLNRQRLRIRICRRLCGWDGAKDLLLSARILDSWFTLVVSGNSVVFSRL